MIFYTDFWFQNTLICLLARRYSLRLDWKAKLR